MANATQCSNTSAALDAVVLNIEYSMYIFRKLERGILLKWHRKIFSSLAHHPDHRGKKGPISSIQVLPLCSTFQKT